MLLLFLIIFILFLSVLANKVIWKHEIVWEEMGINFLILLALLGLFWQWSYNNKVQDYEILNGQVIDKYQKMVSCSHAYSCNCHRVCTGRKSRSCHQECDTCHEHFSDYDYIVKSNIGNFNIPREDRQGTITPHLYNQVVQGQSVVKKHQYDNLIKGSENSLFNFGETVENQQKIPDYPDKIENIFQVKRVLWLSQKIPPWNNNDEHLLQANHYLSEKLKTTGFNKQANVVIVIADAQEYSENFAFALFKKWNGGKKNDVLVVLGLNSSTQKLEYVRIHSWSLHTLFDVQLRDHLLDLNSMQNFDLFKVIDIIDKDLQHQYVRRSFKEFEYLRWEIIPSTWEMILFTLVSILLSLGIGFIFSKNQYRERL